MDKSEKLELSEQDICGIFITPALLEAGWDRARQIRTEVTITPGPIAIRGETSFRKVSKGKRADYVLYFKKDAPVAVVEAKKNIHPVSHGLQQAENYAELLGVPSAFSSNGDAFAGKNKVPKPGEEIITEFPLHAFPSPEVLWERYLQYREISEGGESLIFEPIYQDPSGKEPRYYQLEVINRVMEKVAEGEKRILMVMATGTGKTYTAFQIIWKLWKSGKAKRVLFLVDRNILADQTLVNDFKPFGSQMTKVKNRKIDPAYEIHLALYQAITGPEEEDKIYKTVSPDFFDLIVVDECHRGSAKDDSAWREILDYFQDAIQLGMTATPKETKYVSNITYFGEPVYTYSLKKGIEDGFLAPYKVVRINIDKDLEGWTPEPGTIDDLGREIEERTYSQEDMNRVLVLNQRIKLVAKCIMDLLRRTDPYAKTIVFCEDIEHAERMRVALINEAGQLALTDNRYVMRITGDSKEGKDELDNFIDPESRYPVIATTSELMTTGVDAKTCKLIVLDKTIKSMTTFKQIVGRGTRLDEDYGKFYFTIMDFKKATLHFKDEGFDGEPAVIYEPQDDEGPVPPDPYLDPDDPDDPYDDGTMVASEPRTKYYKGDVSVKILSKTVEYIDPDTGKPVTESYWDYSRSTIQEKFSSLDDFIQNWKETAKKEKILSLLKDEGVDIKTLQEEIGQDYGAFDLICHIAFDQPPMTRTERVSQVKKKNYFNKYGDKARAVLERLLDLYATEGVESIESTQVLRLSNFEDLGTPMEIVKDIFNGKENYQIALKELEEELYKDSRSA